MRSDCPVVVMLHGGFWRARYSAAHLGHAAAALTQRGLATWNVEYRRVGEASGGWPTTFTDVARAIAFLEQLAQEVTLDLSKVVILGHSAGGHLALWSAAAQATTGVAAWSPRWRPRGLIGLAAVSDLRLADALNLSDGAVSGLLGRDSLAARLAQTSPLELLPLGLPQVLVHGDLDSVVPPAMSSAYAARALAVGDPARELRIADCGHFELIDPTSTAWPSVCEVVSQMLRR